MITTKAEVLKYVKDTTETFSVCNSKLLTAQAVSQSLSISRSLASQYLNELFNERYLIKVCSRPVLFMHKEVLHYTYGTVIKSNEYLSLTELQNELKLVKKQDDLYGLIGSKGTLKTAVDQVKASISYPPYGLPLLIIGSEGTGKETLVKSIKKYAVKNNIIQEEKMFLTIDFAKTSLHEIMEVLNNENVGLVYFQNIQVLNIHETELLLDIVNRNVKTLKTSHILASAQRKEDLKPGIYELFPMKTKLSNLEERYLEERRAFVIKFFKNESSNIKKMLKVNDQIIDLFANTKYLGQIGELQNAIKMVCAKANSGEHSVTGLEIHLYHLRDFVDSQLLAAEMKKSVKETLIPINDYVQTSDLLFKHYNDILLNSYKIQSYVLKYKEYLLKEATYDLKHISDIQFEIERIFNAHVVLNKEQFLKDYVEYFAICIYTIKQNEAHINQWEQINYHLLSNVLLNIKNTYPKEHQKIEVILLSVYNYLGIKINELNKIVLIILFSEYNKLSSR